MVGGGTVDNLKGFHKGVGNGRKRKIKISGEASEAKTSIAIPILIGVVIVATLILLLVGMLSGCTHTEVRTEVVRRVIVPATPRQEVRPPELYGYMELPGDQEYPVIYLSQEMYESLPRAGKDFTSEELETIKPFGYRFICEGSPEGVIILGELVRGENAIYIQYKVLRFY